MAGNEPLVWTPVTEQLGAPAPLNPPEPEGDFAFDLGRALAALDGSGTAAPPAPAVPQTAPLPGTATPVFTPPPAGEPELVRWPQGGVTPVPPLAPPAGDALDHPATQAAGWAPTGPEPHIAPADRHPGAATAPVAATPDVLPQRSPGTASWDASLAAGSAPADLPRRVGPSSPAPVPSVDDLPRRGADATRPADGVGHPAETAAAVATAPVAPGLPQRPVPADAAMAPAPAPVAPGLAQPPADVPVVAVAPAPVAPGLPQRMPTGPADAPAVAPTTVERVATTLREANTDLGAAVAAADARPGAPVIPSLPELVLAPAPPPPPQAQVEAERAANPAEIRQFRQAQMRASRHARKGRVFGRMLLFFVLFAGSVGFALTIGRTYMFPTSWDAPLEPAVLRLESARGPGFAHVVPLVDEPSTEYAATLAEVLLTGHVADHLPVWRALGLATASVDDPALAASLSAAFPALYDAAGDRIVRRPDASDEAVAAAVADAFATHLTLPDRAPSDPVADTPVAPLGLVPIADLVGALVEPPTGQTTTVTGTREGPTVLVAEGHAQTNSPGAAVAEALEVLPDSNGVVTPGVDEPAATPAERTAELDPAVIDRLPLPLRYQLVAPARLAAVLAGATDVGKRLDDSLGTAPTAVLGSADTAVGAPRPLGADDWTLVWAARLDGAAVDRLVAATAADAVQPFVRGTTTCVAATFAAVDELAAATLVGDLTAWVAAGPSAAGAEVTALDATTAQLVTCDPGSAAVAPRGSAVEAVIGRQLARLG